MKKTFRLVYNPYTVQTKLEVLKKTGQFESIGENSTMAPIFNQRMQQWLSPNGAWKGFYAELKAMSGEDQVVIYFVGTEDDYIDLNNARLKYTPSLGLGVELKNVLNKTDQYLIKGESKLVQINQLIEDAKEKADKTIVPEEIFTTLERALSSSFEINVMAPVSAGKSTLQNALLGRRLLPTASQAKTAVITRTIINNGISEYRATSKLHNGKTQSHNEKITQSFIEQLNDEEDTSAPVDPHNPNSPRPALREEIVLEGPCEKFKECALNLVFVDTPGGNNAMNARHKDVMRRALFDENKNMILFVFSVNTIDHENTKEALLEAADAMKKSLNERTSQDRFLFVCTGCDLIPGNLDNTEAEIRKVLSACGIPEPKLFMVSALAEELFGLQDFNDKMMELGKEDQCVWLDENDEVLLTNCINCLTLPTCNLYLHSSLPNDIREEIGAQITELREACSERQEWLRGVKQRRIQASIENKVRAEEELDVYKRKLARLNSGMYGLEYTIREYLNRYAIPMKIQQACVSVQAKADEVSMKKAATAKWSESKEAAQNAKREADAKLADYERSKRLKTDHSKISALSLDKNKIVSKQAVCLKKLGELPMPSISGSREMTIGGKKGIWISENSANTYLRTLNNSIISHMKYMVDEMTTYFNDNFVEVCNGILSDYQKHINELQDKGMFDLDGLDIKKMIAAAPEFKGSLDMRKMTATTRECTGTKIVPKSGFWNGVRRFFGSDKGYETVSVYDNVSYVFVPEIYDSQKAKMLKTFTDWVKKNTEDLEESISNLKEEVINRMNSLDSFITSVYDEYRKKLSDTQALNEEAEMWKAQSDWINDFMFSIEQLLEVEINRDKADSNNTQKKTNLTLIQ